MSETFAVALSWCVLFCRARRGSSAEEQRCGEGRCCSCCCSAARGLVPPVPSRRALVRRWCGRGCVRWARSSHRLLWNGLVRNCAAKRLVLAFASLPKGCCYLLLREEKATGLVLRFRWGLKPLPLSVHRKLSECTIK